MPLVRFQVRNEFALGNPEMYKAADKEDPKAVLDGVAVAGLVGILRQLGDLAEFAAEVFHGLQEQVAITTSRSQNLKTRVQKIEAALSPLEKAILAQTSHIHFAYTTGTEWHPRIQNEKNQFIYNDLPQFMMDSYEDCRAPPRFHLLDKFDMGGPGSCLKRYSDPAFFKRASDGEAKVEKVHKDNKAHKIKSQHGHKRRSSLKNELSRVTSMYSCSGRMQFTSPIVRDRERDAPSQTASIVDMEMRHDLREHSKSFDLRNRSGYIDCVFDASSARQSHEQEARASSSSLVQSTANNPAKEFFLQKPQVIGNSILDSSSEEQIARSSSSVTWDEKAEIVNSRGRPFDTNGVSDMNFDLNKQERKLVNLRHVDQLDILLNGAGTRQSVSSKKQGDEIDSETDNYVDALNIIESESEIDTECHAKQELDYCSSDANYENKEDGVDASKLNNVENQQSKDEPDAASIGLSNNAASRTSPEFVASKSLASEQITELSCKPLDLDHSLGTDMYVDDEILQSSKAEPIAVYPPSSGSRVANIEDPLSAKMVYSELEFPKPHLEISSVPSMERQTNGETLHCSKVDSSSADSSSTGSVITDSHCPPGETIVNGVCESTKPLPKISGAPSVTIWTNGGLLGLMPSKPPDFAQTSAAGQTTSKSDDAVDNCDTSHCSSSRKYADDGDRSLNAEMSAGNKLVANSYVNSKSIESDKRKDDMAAMFGLGQRLLTNGFNINGIKSEAANSFKAMVLDQRSAEESRSHGKIYKEEVGSRSPAYSLTSSPPLELMKISFNPIDGTAASKLKLKFPDGSHSHESNGEIFPSFQLVPDLVIPARGVVSDSDDDTFCRSSPYESDDCISNYSESNSELWEYGETPDRSDPELFDALSRMPSMESVSNSLHVGKAAKNSISFLRGPKPVASENGTEPSISVPSLDLPSFDVINQAGPGATNSNSTFLSESQNFREPGTMPLPPPLPPAQWRVTTPAVDIAEGRKKTLPESLRHELDLKHLVSAVPDNSLPPAQWRVTTPAVEIAEGRQKTLPESPRHELDLKHLVSAVPDNSKPPSANQQKISEEAAAFKFGRKLSLPNPNRQGVANGTVSSKVMDEKEEFLNQIRSKSFNLRPTVTAKPSVPQGPTANVKITAILKKASAIRQAVASDDGETDDNWSDS